MRLHRGDLRRSKVFKYHKSFTCVCQILKIFNIWADAVSLVPMESQNWLIHVYYTRGQIDEAKSIIETELLRSRGKNEYAHYALVINKIVWFNSITEKILYILSTQFSFIIDFVLRLYFSYHDLPIEIQQNLLYHIIRCFPSIHKSILQYVYIFCCQIFIIHFVRFL